MRPPDQPTPPDDVLAQVGPRLKRRRLERGVTLAALSRETGISVSTLSRLEAGLRRPNLELLLPIARAHGVPLDDLVGQPPPEDPRVTIVAQRMNGVTVEALTRHSGGLQAFKMTLPADPGEPEQRTHRGYEWIYVLSGRLRLLLATYDLVLGPGEAAEFDTRLPHWFGSTGEGPVEVLSLFGSQGERVHLRARPRTRRDPPRPS